jgi:hypothetical protein
MEISSLFLLRLNLKTYQKRIAAGDSLPSIADLASMAGVHRDTMYSFLAGNRVNQRSHYAIAMALQKVTEITSFQPTKLLSVSIGISGPKLNFGLKKPSMFNGC